MRQPGMAADFLWEDFLFSHVGVVPIKLTRKRQPFLSAEHTSPPSRDTIELWGGSCIEARLRFEKRATVAVAYAQRGDRVNAVRDMIERRQFSALFSVAIT
jgi:hypothetical protein